MVIMPGGRPFGLIAHNVGGKETRSSPRKDIVAL